MTIDTAGAPPGSAARLRSEMRSADRVISVVTWGVAAGMVLWSVLNATPYVAGHVAPGWEAVAWVLPIVVDLAFIGALRADEIASRYGASGGAWAALFRLFTGAASVFLNIGSAAEKGDVTGVLQHLIAPGILVLVAEAGPAWRRRLAARLEEVEETEAQQREEQRREAQREADRRRRERQEDEDRRRAQQREDEDRRRAVEREEREQAQAREAEQAREARRHELEMQRLALEARRLERQEPQPPAPKSEPVPAAVVQRPEAAPVPAQQPAPAAVAADPAPRPQAAAPERSAVAAAATTAPARITARVDQEEPETPEEDDISPERARQLIREGWERGMSTRECGRHAHRSATIVSREYRKLEAKYGPQPNRK